MAVHTYVRMKGGELIDPVMHGAYVHVCCCGHSILFVCFTHYANERVRCVDRLSYIMRMVVEIVRLQVSMLWSRSRHVTYLLRSSWYGYRYRHLKPTAEDRYLFSECIHGVRTGGCGIDYMCQYCEDGWSFNDYAYMIATEHKRRAKRYRILSVLVPLSIWVFRYAPRRFHVIGTYLFNKGWQIYGL